jgi:SAM-dependent methyltransferase
VILANRSHFELAVDLGCGPGWTTQLLDPVLKPQRTVGLDSSERYIVETRANYPKLEFLRHDILQTPFPVEERDLFLCRFLLTHLPSPQTALLAWANVAAPLSTLLITRQNSSNPITPRYAVTANQLRRCSATMVRSSMWEPLWTATLLGPDGECSRAGALVVERSARDMAQLHSPIYVPGAKNEYAAQAFDRRELDQLEARHSIP